MDTNWVATVFEQLWNQKNRVTTAKIRRDIMREQLIEGIVPQSNRYRFIVESAQMIGDFIQDIADGFDRSYPDDCCLTLDVGDMLLLVQHRYGLLKKK